MPLVERPFDMARQAGVSPPTNSELRSGTAPPPHEARRSRIFTLSSLLMPKHVQKKLFFLKVCG